MASFVPPAVARALAGGSRERPARSLAGPPAARIMDPQFQTLNPFVAAMQPSATLAITARAAALRREGVDVIGLSAGEPDFPTPAPIVEAAHQALRDEKFGYTANAGTPELRAAIADKLTRVNGLDVAARADVICSNGAKQSIAQAILAAAGPGDEVAFAAPYWVSYPEQARLAGRRARRRPDGARPTGYVLRPDALDAALTERTRVLILNSPSNPTGTVLARADMEALAERAASATRACSSCRTRSTRTSSSTPSTSRSGRCRAWPSGPSRSTASRRATP